MKSTMRKLIAWILVLVLLSTNVCAIAAALDLPQAMTIIGEEAFYGTTSIDKVVVPDNVKEIRARAFADSTITEINLPSSIEYIADDAFDGCRNLKIIVPRDSYAHGWAALSNVDYVVVADENARGAFDVAGVEIITGDDGRCFIGATVTADLDCVLEMRVLSDDDQSVLQTVQVSVAAPAQEQLVEGEITIQLPQYYILEAVLKDQDGKELCEAVRSKLYSSSFAALERRTQADYPAEKVLNFGASGFAVLAEDVLPLNANAINEGSSYTFSTDENLQRGDIIQLKVAGVDHVIKVGSLSRSGSSVTVNADPNITISEMYDAVKVSGNMVGAAAAVSEGEGGAHVFSMDHSLQTGPFELSSHLEMTINVKCYYDKWIFDDLHFEGTARTNGEITVSFAGDVDTFRDWNAPAFQIYNQVVILPGIHAPGFLNVSVPLNVVAKAGGSASFGFDNTYGFIAGGGNGFKTVKKEGESHTELKAGGEAELTFGPEIGFTVALFGVVNARLGAQFGPRLTAKMYAQDANSNAAEVHACTSCLDIDIYAVADARAALSYKLGKHVSGMLLDGHITFYEEKLGDAYYSLINEIESIYGGKKSGGMGECKNLKYRTSVSTVDMFGNPLQDIPVTITGAKTKGVDATTPYITYLYSGDYNAKAKFNSLTVNEKFAVEDAAFDLIICNPAIDISGCITDYTTLNPVSGAEVTIHAPGGKVVTATTDARGNYTAKGLPYGAYTFDISAKKYEPQTGLSASFTTGTEGRFDATLIPSSAYTAQFFASAQARLQGEDIEVKGVTYSDAIVYDMRYTGYGYTASMGEVTYNLDGQFSSVSFDVGFYTGWERNAVLKIYKDGTLADEVNLKYTDPSRHLTYFVGGTRQLVIRMESPGYDYCRYAIGNLEFSPKRLQPEDPRVSDTGFDSYRYTASQCDVVNSFAMGGNNYHGGYLLHMGANWCTNTSYVGLDFNGECSSLSFEVAKKMQRIPEAYIDSAYITIEVDGEILPEYDNREMKWNDLVLPVNINLSGVDQVFIKLNYYAYDRGYWGIGNIHVS